MGEQVGAIATVVNNNRKPNTHHKKAHPVTQDVLFIVF